MSRIRILCATLLVSCFVTSCSDFESSGFVSIDSIPLNQSLLSETFIVSEEIFIPGAVVSDENHLIVVDNTNENIFKVFSLPDLTHEFSYGLKGNGPGELKAPDPSSARLRGRFFEIQDFNKVKRYELAGGALNYKDERMLPILGNPINRLTKLNDSIYIADNAMTAANVELIRLNLEKQEIQARFSGYDKDDLEFETNEQQYQAYLKSIVSSPSGDKFAAFYYHFNRFKIFDSSGNILKRINVEDESRPNRKYSIHDVKQNLIHQASPFATEEHIYSLDVGKTKDEIMSDLDNFRPKLNVWDWNGNPVARFQLDKPVICFTIVGNKLYGLSFDKLNEVYVYDLPPLNSELQELADLVDFENTHFKTQLFPGWQPIRDETEFALGSFSCIEQGYYDPTEKGHCNATVRTRMLFSGASEVSLEDYFEKYANKQYQGFSDIDLRTDTINSREVASFSFSLNSTGPDGKAFELFSQTWVWSEGRRVFELSYFDCYNSDVMRNSIGKIINSTSSII